MRSLAVRLPLLAVAVLAGSLAAATLVAYRLLLVSSVADLDRALRDEQQRFAAAVAAEVVEAVAERDQPLAEISAAVVLDAAREYQATVPGSSDVLSVATVAGERVDVPRTGPELRSLLREGLPATPPGRIVTRTTGIGRVRSLVAPIAVGPRQIGALQLVGWLEPARREAVSALPRLVAAAVAGLVLGGSLLALVLRRAVAPLRDLAATARATDLADLSARVAVPAEDDEVGALARDFNAMLERLADAAEERRRFLSTVSHELRTPITAARGHLEVLAATASDEATATTADVVANELRRMSLLVEDLLALARAEARGFVLPRPTSLPRLFDDLRLRLAGLQADTVVVEAPPDVALEADPDRLAQALGNLVVNALVHAPAGTPVRVSARVDAAGVHLVVSDEGPGIAPEVRAGAFEPFVTGGGSASTGLGLAVVKAVAEAHGGTAQILDGVPGTTVVLSLPPPATTGPREPALG